MIIFDNFIKLGTEKQMKRNENNFQLLSHYIFKILF